MFLVDIIFVIYDGKHTPAEMNNLPELNFIPEVRVFDWKGNFVKSFCLAEHAYSIEFNDVTKNLYSIDFDGKLYKYDLSKYLK